MPCPDACVRWAGQGISSAPEPSVCAQEVELDHPLLPTHAPALWSFLKGPHAPSVAEVGISAPLRDPPALGVMVGQPVGSSGRAQVIGKAQPTGRFRVIFGKVHLAAVDPGTSGSTPALRVLHQLPCSAWGCQRRVPAAACPGEARPPGPSWHVTASGFGEDSPHPTPGGWRRM